MAAPLLVWIESNWFNFVQTAGIVAGLVFTGIELRASLREKRVNGLLTLTANHRELWKEAFQREELSRVFSEAVDLVGRPVTVAETEFLNLVIVHFMTGFELAKGSSLVVLQDLTKDAADFFSLPIPKAIWTTTKHIRNRQFATSC